MKITLEFIFIALLAFTFAILTAWLLRVFEGKTLPEPIDFSPQYEIPYDTGEGKG